MNATSLAVSVQSTTGLIVGVDLAKTVFALCVARNAGKQVTGLRAWALGVQDRSNHNKACCALANKLARIAYACLRDHAPYDEAKPTARNRWRWRGSPYTRG